MVMGRPREFDAEKALDRAVELFWAQGYEGTSLTDLTEAIGVNKPSLYAAFGGKEQLFLKALDRYQERLGSFAAPSLMLPSARSSIETFLRALATFQSTDGTPRGCLLVQGALAGSTDSKRVTEALCKVRESGVEMIRQCLDRARKQGELPPRTDIDALARYFVTVSQGISVQATSGVPTEELHKTISIAMNSWPASPPSRSKRHTKETAGGKA
ncbi:TetR family transcriptional regulator [Caballeronia sordidicola]|uniref:TetR family transcriptional regulator n=1 Tax=Caballeronia sordidicola TaxID=196367 RepID=A0A158EQ44_CABSO|nr:TetR/AcrR family transcriptional regulator [Caballeronia sordidicola]SAL09688.1 TetR family transcriptional regulator [Caballeronia sordidicola]